MLTRTIHLQIIPNAGKLENLRYSASRFVLFTQHFITQIFFNRHIRHMSAAGMGTLANQAQYKAMRASAFMRLRPSRVVIVYNDTGS